MYAVIMAGGRGTRLWPYSRSKRPKQLLKLVSHVTMLQETYERIAPLLLDREIFVITNRAYADLVREQLPRVPEGNVIGEPEGHGTAPCIGLAALYLMQCDPKGVMAVLPADHVISQEEEFRRVLSAAQAAEEGYLVTLGIEPDRPATGYGYICRGEFLTKLDDYNVYRVKKFTEKPDPAAAQEFLRSGQYYWNSGMFVWKVSTILGEIERFMPALYSQLMEVEGALGTPKEGEVLERVWAQVEDETIDYGVMERAEDVAVVPVDIGWSDVGDWATLRELLPSDREGNVVVGKHMGLGTRQCLVHSSRLVATIGLEDMIIVDTDDVLLICPKDRAQDVKRLVGKLKETGRDEYL